MERLIALLALIAGFVFVCFLLAWPSMWLWNECLVPAVSVLHEVSWPQMWGICILFNMLVKSSVSNSK